MPYARADGVLLPVPYDFDSSGIVDAPYPLPEEACRFRTSGSGSIAAAAATSRRSSPCSRCSRRSETRSPQLFTPAAGLPESTAERANDYIDDFYAVLADAEEIEKRFRSGCNR